jgi:predicted PurR-regulated permease PerM
MEPGTPHTWPPARAIDTFIRLVLLGGLLLWCVLILAPFTSILLWAVILAVALYPLFAALAHRLGGRTTWAAALIVVTGLTAVAVPGYFTGRSLVNSVNILRGHLSAEELHVPQLPADWYQGTGIRRIIADRWPSKDSAVAELIESHSAEIQAGAKHTLQALSGFTMGLLMLILSILVAGVLLANAKAGSSAAERFLDRVMGRNGAAMVDLAASTVRQVAKGILGVAHLLDGGDHGLGQHPQAHVAGPGGAGAHGRHLPRCHRWLPPFRIHRPFHRCRGAQHRVSPDAGLDDRGGGNC